MLNYDNDDSKLLVEHCYRTTKTLVNPIIDWEEEDVWEFLNDNNIPHCSLYDEGFKRLGCIGCPLSGSKNMERDFARWPKYKELYIKAFQRMIDNHPGQIKIMMPEYQSQSPYVHELQNLCGGGYNNPQVVDPHAPMKAAEFYSADGLKWVPCKDEALASKYVEIWVNEDSLLTHRGVVMTHGQDPAEDEKFMEYLKGNTE